MTSALLTNLFHWGEAQEVSINASDSPDTSAVYEILNSTDCVNQAIESNQRINKMLSNWILGIMVQQKKDLHNLKNPVKFGKAAILFLAPVQKF